jgi:hypothetical protein
MRLVTVNLDIDPESGLEEEFDDVPQSEWWFWTCYYKSEPDGLCCVYGYQDPDQPHQLIYSQQIEVCGRYVRGFGSCCYDHELFALTNNTDNYEFICWFEKLSYEIRKELMIILPF